MWTGLRFLPERASTVSGHVDALLLLLLAVSIFFAGLIFVLVAVFAIKYRRRAPDEKPRPIPGSLALELTWTIIPLALAMVMFGWGAWVYVSLSSPPPEAMEIFVVGKQWMWKLQHPDGHREINELHVPVGRTVKLTMTSEDVIHSFFVPAFRIKKDVVPGRYNTAWFQATKTGEYRLFCTQYCGTSHAGMTGKVVVMEENAYEAWLRGAGAAEAPAAAGARQFQRLGCAGCHLPDGSGRAPSLVGLFGKPVPLEGKRTVVADGAYVRQSILEPQAKIVAGYPPIMPTYKGLINEEGLAQLLAYIRSLGIEQKAKAQ